MTDSQFSRWHFIHTNLRHLWFLLLLLIFSPLTSALTLVLSEPFLQVILPPLLVSVTIAAAVPTFSSFSCTDPSQENFPGWKLASGPHCFSLWPHFWVREVREASMHWCSTGELLAREQDESVKHWRILYKIWRISSDNASRYLLIPQGKFLAWSEHKSGILHMLCFCLSCLGTVMLVRL